MADSGKSILGNRDRVGPPLSEEEERRRLDARMEAFARLRAEFPGSSKTYEELERDISGGVQKPNQPSSYYSQE